MGLPNSGFINHISYHNFCVISHSSLECIYKNQLLQFYMTANFTQTLWTFQQHFESVSNPIVPIKNDDHRVAIKFLRVH